MQLCTIYKSTKKAETYLYIEKKGDFSEVPKPLMELVGKLVLVMTMNLDERKSLANADVDKVRAELKDKGFYLQLPPPQENMLDEFKKQNGHVDSE